MVCMSSPLYRCRQAKTSAGRCSRLLCGLVISILLGGFVSDFLWCVDELKWSAWDWFRVGSKGMRLSKLFADWWHPSAVSSTRFRRCPMSLTVFRLARPMLLLETWCPMHRSI
jgi:hypothetical protein